MKSLWKCLVQNTLIFGVGAGLAATAVAQDGGPEGIVRISKPRTAVANANVTPASAMMMDAACNATQGAGAPAMAGNGACDPSMGAGAGVGAGSGDSMSTLEGFYDGDYYRGRRGMYAQDWRTTDWQGSNRIGSGFRARAQAHSMALERGWYGHSGYGPYGAGCNQNGNAMCDYFRCKFGYFIPSGNGGKGVPWTGHYARVYPVNPYYSDPRDGQAYAAQGYGIPMAVPLAPVVGHTYDYSWGVPSSRLTPVSNPAY